MQILKNIFVGFIISFIGSIPLGYMNIVGYEFLKINGLSGVTSYLLGIILIEFFVIYFTLIFSNKLIANKKLIKFIEGFSVVFIFLLAYIFYSNASKEVANQSILEEYAHYSPFVIGIILSGSNFAQVPFWASWHLYLLNGNYIEVSKSRKYFYVAGTVLGTFSGMLTLILSLDYVTNQTDFLAKYLMKIIVPLLFAGLGLLQLIKFYKKWCSQKN